MPRQARIKSNSGIYHIMLRGINRQQIFEDDEDRVHFLETLQNYKEQCGYAIYAYCLMGNHIHLLLKEGQENLKGRQGTVLCLNKTIKKTQKTGARSCCRVKPKD